MALRQACSPLALAIGCGLLIRLLDLGVTPAQATDYYWDIDGATAGAGGATPSGTWSAGGTTLTTDANGAAAAGAVTTTTADRLFFSAGTNATGSYTVTVSGTVNINRLSFQEGTVTLTGGTVSSGGGVLTIDGTGDTIASTIAGGGVNFNGGSVRLTGTNSFTGTARLGGSLAGSTVTLEATGGNAISGNVLSMGAGSQTTQGGTVILAADEQINDTATLSMASGHYSGSSLFALNGFDETLGGINLTKNGLSSSVTVRNGAAADSTLTLAGSGTYTTASGDRTFGRSIQNGSTGRLHVVVALTGAGHQTFSGTVPIYTGDTTVNSGTLRLWNTSGWNSNAILNGGTLNLHQTTAGTGNLAGAATRTHARTIGGAGGTLLKTGDGTVILSGANTYEGATAINEGILRAGSPTAFGINSAVSFANVAGAAMELNGFNIAVGSLAGGGATGGSIVLGAATLTTGGNNTNTSYGGVISGTGALVKTGTGTQTLIGVNTYMGTTTVAAGTLRVNGSLDAASAVTANSGATLGGSGTVNGTVNIAAGAVLDPGGAAGTVGLLTTGALTLDAGSQLTYDLGEANVVGGANNDRVQVNGNLALGGVVNVNAPGGAFANTLLPGSYRLIDYTGALSGTLGIGSIPAGFAASQVQTVVPGQVNLIAVQDGVPVQFWDGADTVGNNVVDGGTQAWNNTDSNWSNSAGSINQSWLPGVGIFTGTAGVATVAQPINAMGLQFITTGYEVAGSTITLIARPDGSAPFIRVDPGATVEISAPIAGTAGLTKADGGTLILSGANSYTGGTVISNGTLQLGDGGNSGSILGDVANDGVLAFNRGNILTFGGVISGSGRVDQSGIGTTVLTANNSYSGGTTINAGVLQIGNGGASGSILGDVTNNGTLSFNRNDTVTFGSVISGGGGVTHLGSGTTMLTADNTYSGTTTVAAGTLRVNGALASASVTANAGSTLGGSGTLAGPVTIAAGATLDPGATAGAIGVLTMGALTLGATSQLEYDLGEANVVGGANNDRIQVNGNLTLGGAVNVNAPGGNFASTLLPGSYRLIDYTGALAGGMAVGSVPADFGASQIQTVIGGQVNLIAVQNGVPMQFWDGTDTAADGTLDGGTDSWSSSRGNWTNSNGSINQSWVPGVGVFTGTAGVATLARPTSAMGLQFVTDGYEVTGSQITMIARPGAGMPFVRVEPGTTAEISAPLTGTAGLLKADGGTLILSGTNAYAGGTVIGGGTLQLGDGGTSGSIVGDVANSGALAFNRSDTAIFGGAVSGTGAVNQIGTGTMVLTGNSTHTGGTMIAAGTLQLGDGGSSGSIAGNVTNNGTLAFNRSDTLIFGGAISGAGAVRQIGSGLTNLTGNSSGFAGTTTVEDGTLAVNGTLCGDVDVLAGARLQGTGTVCTTMNAGIVAPGNSIGTLTVAGNYTGNGGTLEIETVLGGDASPTDRLVVTGDTAGSTNVRIINLGGAGAQTNRGIKIVDVGGTSNGNFSLLGDYVFQGEQTVVGGAYAYRLYKNGLSTPADGDWYLRSALIDPDDPVPQPLYAPGVPLYEAYAGTLQSFNRLGTLRQRVGTRSWGEGVTAQGADFSNQGSTDNNAIWGRIEAAHAELDPEVSTSGAAYEATIWKLQAGLDGLLYEIGAGVLIGGVTIHYGTVTSDVESIFGTGSIGTTGGGFGGTLTWYGGGGLYVDAQAEATWYDSDLRSTTLGRALAEGNDGFGYAFSVEAGQRVALPGSWSLTPQAQLAYSSVDFESFVDPFGAAVSLGTGENLTGRLGVSADYEAQWTDAGGRSSRMRVYGIADIHYEFLGGSSVAVSGASFASRNQELWGGFGLGGTLSWDDGAYSVYGEAFARTSLEDFGASNGIGAKLGFKVRW